MPTTILYTDASTAYDPMTRDLAGRRIVDHQVGKYVTRDGASTNMAENFFSQLERSLDGTHHHVSRAHLPRYLAEFDFRYTTREMTDGERMITRMAQVGGRRLRYKA